MRKRSRDPTSLYFFLESRKPNRSNGTGENAGCQREDNHELHFVDLQLRTDADILSRLALEPHPVADTACSINSRKRPRVTFVNNSIPLCPPLHRGKKKNTTNAPPTNGNFQLKMLLILCKSRHHSLRSTLLDTIPQNQSHDGCLFGTPNSAASQDMSLCKMLRETLGWPNRCLDRSIVTR